MTTQATTASVLESSLRPVRAQLDLAIEQTTGTAQRSIESATVLLNQAQSLCIEQLNIETDEYNLLFDRLEKAESDLTIKSLALTQVQERIENADLFVAEANAQRDSISAKYNLSLSDQRVLATEVNRLKSLNPEKMKIQIVRLKDELDNKRTLLNQQLTDIRRHKKDVAEKTSKLAAMINVNNQLTNTVADLTVRIQRMDGDVEPTYYRGDDGIEFYFYTFQWGLKLRSGDYDMQLINDIDWHIEIRSTSGIGLIVSVNEWALPVYPLIDNFKQNWPDGLTPAVTQRIRDLLEPTHPHLVKRAEWAETVLTESLPLKEQYLDLLALSGIHSLFDVVRRTPDMLANAVKGFGITTARQVHAQCSRIVKEWESEQKQKEAA
ncbi:coiled-coil domain-containing protein [Yersinia rohdei]|uniref:hypothetical protein n=1 Tax=Yersinia rohdei TaxID=29485 RepID=UPI0011A220EC|nr:hypothetical protein [Yersinia rohdei]